MAALLLAISFNVEVANFGIHESHTVLRLEERVTPHFLQYFMLLFLFGFLLLWKVTEQELEQNFGFLVSFPQKAQ